MNTIDETKKKFAKLIELLKSGEWLDEQGRLDEGAMTRADWDTWALARMTPKGKVILITAGEITDHDNSSGDRWQEQSGVGENGKSYTRSRILPDWDAVRCNHGSREDNYMARNKNVGWSMWKLS